jgi:hypothetical protein
MGLFVTVGITTLRIIGPIVTPRITTLRIMDLIEILS